jgi:beta-phosphoglucomutase
MNLPEAIFFDFDGVLLDTEPLHWACWSEALAKTGIPLSWDYYVERCVGIEDPRIIRTLAGEADPPRSFESLWALYPEKRRLFQERTAIPPFEPALCQLLPVLHRRFRLAVVTSSAAAEIEPLLIRGGIREHFDTIVGGADVTHHKPAPDPYRLAASRLGVSHALVMEDSAAGIAAARAAGFEVIEVKHPADVPGLLRARLGE